MILWISFAVIAAIVIAALAWPMLAEEVDNTSSTEEAELAVYRDQLAEIEADQERGLIDTGEAESARVELARRLLTRSDLNESPESGVASDKRWPSPAAIAYASAVTIPILTISVYLSLGSPSMPGMPQAARLEQSPAQSKVTDLVAKVEARLRESPEDGRGWEVIAPVYMRLGRFDDAANAFAQSIRLLGETTNRLKGFAEANVLANNGIVAEPARLAYKKILEKEAGDHEAKFWLAMADEQDGKLDEAEAGYRTVLAEAPDEAPWKSVVESRLTAIAKRRGGATADSSIERPNAPMAQGQPASPAEVEAPGPTAEDVAAAAQMSKSDQQEMINTMVERLAVKLEKNPEDFEGWLRLVRAYSVLGRKNDANHALTNARKAANGDNQKITRLDALANELGLGT